PGPLASLVADARNGVGADGLLARVQLLVWPDAVPYKPCERWPDHEAKQEVRRIFRKIAEADYSSRGGHVDQFGGPPAFRFDAAAQAIFDSWFEALEVRLRSGDIEDPALKSALSKYRSLVPSLALVYHLVSHVDSEKIPPVDVAAVESAIGWAVYLEAHARRVYGCSGGASVSPGARLARRLSELPAGFTRRDLQRKGWSGLRGPEELDRAIHAACERRWILAYQAESGTGGGRPTVRYWRNPLESVSAASAGPLLVASDLVGVMAEWAAASDDRSAQITPKAAGLYQLQASSAKCHQVHHDFPLGMPETELLALLADMEAESRRLGPRDVQAELAEVRRRGDAAFAAACAEAEARMDALKAAAVASAAAGVVVVCPPPPPPPPPPAPVPVV
ncbi:DUF3987 domain-containing protein, partial [Paludisphaera rhizosphaerae]|uniref:DUF3987 domain-containing protein n=1 Tax=Paludisphaera rhizosphaerae TaxID=2711216 RepID=UPI0013EB14B0